MMSADRSFFNEALEMLRADDAGTVERGLRFERLIRKALADHPGEYGPLRFTDVWLWNDWPGRDGPDTGIDLVAREHDGVLCAVQCKFYDNSKKLSSGVDKFLAMYASGRFGRGVFVSTTELTNNAYRKLQNANIEIITPVELEAWPVDDWRKYVDQPDNLRYRAVRYAPHPYQTEAVDAIVAGLQTNDRGRLVLPCGTGKSVVALWAAEQLAGKAGRVLYLVPSIALMGQTMREWAVQRTPDIKARYLGVCSDETTGRNDEGIKLAELEMPVTTSPEKIAGELAQEWDEAMHVTFCTYQSLPVIIAAQQQDDQMPVFDLVICDEAHRTTGIEETGTTSTGKKRAGKPSDDHASHFMLVHDGEKLRASKRLYMTATPRVFGDTAKRRIASVSSEQSRSFDVFTMDDETVYGPELYRLTFGKAVELGCLADYQVVVICMDENAAAFGDSAEYKQTGLALDDAARLLGCWDALADPHTVSNVDRVTGTIPADGASHLQRAIAYTNRIDTSKTVAESLPRLVDTAIAEAAQTGVTPEELLWCETRHIDGTQRADKRAETLAWLKEGPDPDSGPGCRTVSNARCLTEGVDVPALDAVIFLEQRRSQIDIIQAIGRVMRTAPGKEMGYIVLPVVVPPGADPEQYLNTSEFDKVWDVIKALRSHDERVDVEVNTVGLGASNKVRVFQRGAGDVSDSTLTVAPVHTQGTLPLEGAIASKLVEKCGDRQYWPRWGEKAAGISRRVTSRLEALRRSDQTMSDVFDDFADEMRQVVNAALEDDDLIEMLAHHIVTGPVFDSLFARSDFAATNPVSQALQLIVDEFIDRDPDVEKEILPLKELYKSVATAMQGRATSEERLKVLLDVYESFFKAAMADEVQRLGVAYTPIELVDFILASADAAARTYFGRGLTSRNVHVLDPFTGTGTFLYRLLTKSGLVNDIDLARKYTTEMHANEILLLPYYLASVKIEEGYRERLASGGDVDAEHTTFQKIVLTDTFEMGARHTLFTEKGYTAANSKRAREQNETPIVVIVGNPPWSAGQKSSGDDNADISRPDLERRVRDTYGTKQKEITGRAGGGTSSGNLYVQAIRWASDRLGEPDSAEPQAGIVAFVHPSSLITGTSLAGMRAALRDEFTDIFVVNLRGDATQSGEAWQAEGDKIFGQASRNGVQITVLVRDPSKPLDHPAEVHYAACPEYLTRQAKLDWLAEIGDIDSEKTADYPAQ